MSFQRKKFKLKKRFSVCKNHLTACQLPKYYNQKEMKCKQILLSHHPSYLILYFQYYFRHDLLYSATDVRCSFFLPVVSRLIMPCVPTAAGIPRTKK